MADYKYQLGAQNAWTEIDPAVVGYSIIFRAHGSGAVFEAALSDASPAGAGTVVAADVGHAVVVPVGSANSLWVRNTDAAGGGDVEVDDEINGVVFIGA